MTLPPLKSAAELWYSDGSQAPIFEVDSPDPGLEIYRPEVFQTIEEEIGKLDKELKELSIDIHGCEVASHLAQTSDCAGRDRPPRTYIRRNKNWHVKKNHLLKTAWVATFTHGTGGRTLGVNSEMDALPGIGHACGHNLIAIAGVAVALAVKVAMLKHDIPGKLVLIGTPGMFDLGSIFWMRLSMCIAEEGGSGKGILLEKGAYEGIDACLMCHPAAGPKHGASLSSCLALRRFAVEYKGHSAHAAQSPWEGQNALDASVSAYNNISMLRQQLKPSHRVHGVFSGKDWAANIIPDNSEMLWYVRAPTWAEVKQANRAAAHATGCKLTIEDPGEPTYDLRQNKALGSAFSEVFRSKFGPIDYEFGICSASTDFGNVTYAMPALHPSFSIPTVPDGGIHTPAFATAAATPEAHQACLNVAKVLALTGVRVLADDAFFDEVKMTFEEDKKMRGMI
ncbi:hypothetical protein EWM64_g2285 [Hericium alpestre]|uniref:Peptidase M20 domain-containing protein 2 n=1 Tax=Hericium alpestre TaxID=135208 RepID=A0A4Z0A734_9AGAM|nr:hypothetical protein EWM64_g2285 [Hericium alpestre]